MENPQISSPMPRSRPIRAECCAESECLPGLRNNYFVGKRLTPDAFQVEQNYLNERRHLLNRAVFGWGVVYGFPIKAAPPARYEQQTWSGRLQIGRGLALDTLGRELVQAGAIELGLADMILLERPSGQVRPAPGVQSPANQAPCRPIPKPGPDADKGCWLLSVHYAEQDMGPVTIRDPCHCERQKWDQLCETVRYSLRQIDCKECCVKRECELHCDCATGYCCDAYADEAAARTSQDGCPQSKGNPVMRGGCQCICEHLTNLDPDPDCDGLYEIKQPCGRVRVDLHNGVPLACVRLCRDPCSDWVFDTWLEVCGPRRLVKRNDVLFDLIQGCDLTRICKIGWAWHRCDTPVPWRDFVSSFGCEGANGESVTRDYWVEFSLPVRKDTVRPDCFSMTIFVPEHEAGWLQAFRVPIIGVVTECAPGAPSGYVTKATLIVDAGWVDDALKSRKTLFDSHEGWVEIEVLGDYIVDCNGQTIDANPVGLSPAPTGNGTPGGTFSSKFRVAARRSSASKSYEPEYQAQGDRP